MEERMLKKLMLRQHGCPRGSQIGSVTGILVFLFWVTIGTVATAQTKPTNHWQLGGSVGYATSIQEYDRGAYRDLNIQGDSVVGLIPGNYRIGTSSGLQIDVEAIYQKKGGWYSVIGLQSFISIPQVYFYAPQGKFNPDPNLNGRFKEHGGYAMLKLGLGYRVSYARRANLFVGANLMYGGGWYFTKVSSGYEENWESRIRVTYFDSFLLGLGVNAEVGTLLKLNKKLDGLIKAGINAAILSVWDFEKSGFKSKQLTPGDGAHEFFNINFSLGIRYNL